MSEESVDPLGGIISMVCVPSYGFWKIRIVGGRRCWQRLDREPGVDPVVWFLACVSNTCFLAHSRRQGRDLSLGLEGGIGMYLPHPFVEVQV